jgi:glycogen(starch) synthase
VRRLLLLTPSELTRDPRARRAAAAAKRLGLEVVGVSGRASGQPPAELPGVRVLRAGRPGHVDSRRDLRGGGVSGTTIVREARGVYRLVRLAWRTATLVHAAGRVGHVDIVHANDVDTLPAGWLLARRHHARLVYDAHELYTEFEADPPRFSRAAIAVLERRLARAAAAVVTVSDALADELMRRLRLRPRPLVVLNAPELVENVTNDAHAPSAGPLRVVYTGVFGSGRPLADLLNALGGVPEIELTLFALQQSPGELRRLVGERARVAEPLSPDRVVATLRSFDVGVIFDRPVTRNAELALPNKLFEYLMAGLAVVAPALPGLSPIVEREQVGVLFEPGNANDLRRVVQELAKDRTRLAELRRFARHAAVERYNAEAQLPTLAAAWGVA